MNPITSGDFRSRNEILFQSGIITHTGWNFTYGLKEAKTERVGDFDVIDLNRNGMADTRLQHTYRVVEKSRLQLRVNRAESCARF